MRWLTCAILAFSCGCAAVPSQPVTRHARFIDLIWARSTADGVSGWHQQMLRRWPEKYFVAVFCHGGDNRKGQWCLWPDRPLRVVQVEAVAQTLHAVYPHRLIVFLICNPQHEKVVTPDVAYAARSIWTVPGPDAGLWDWPRAAVLTGNIWEFVMTGDAE